MKYAGIFTLVCCIDCAVRLCWFNASASHAISYVSFVDRLSDRTVFLQIYVLHLYILTNFNSYVGQVSSCIEKTPKISENFTISHMTCRIGKQIKSFLTYSPGHKSTAGVTNLFETESYAMAQIHAKGYQFDTHF